MIPFPRSVPERDRKALRRRAVQCPGNGECWLTETATNTRSQLVTIEGGSANALCVYDAVLCQGTPHDSH